MRRTKLAALLASTAFAGSAFVAIDFGGSGGGGFVVSADKLVGLTLMLAAILIVGHVRLSGRLGIVALAVGAAYSVALLPGDLGPAAAGLAIVAVGGTAALALYTALCADREPFRVLGQVWIVFGAVTSVLAVAQATGVVGFLAFNRSRADLGTSVPGFVRAPGLTSDPNYQALAAVIALAFALVLLSGWVRRLAVAVIVLGIFATFSRMGMVLALGLVVFAPVYHAAAAGRVLLRPLVRAVATFMTVALLVTVSYQQAGPELRSYFGERIEDSLSAVDDLGGDAGLQRPGRTSGEERAALFNAGLALARENWETGLGAFGIEEAMKERIGVPRTLHNSYLDMLAMGGAIGVVALGLIFYVVASGVRVRAAGVAKDERALVLVVTLCMATMAFVLSLSYNAIIWLPLVLACVYRRRWLPTEGLAWRM